MKSCFYDTILKDYSILLKNTQRPNKVLLPCNGNFLQYSLNQNSSLFPKECWVVYMYLGNWEILLCFIVYVGSFQSKCITKYVLSREKIQTHLFLKLCEGILRTIIYFTEEEKYCNFEYSSRYLCFTFKQIYCTLMLPIDKISSYFSYSDFIASPLQREYNRRTEDEELVTLKLKRLAILKGSGSCFK